MSHKITKILSKLQEMIDSENYNCHFGNPAQQEAIQSAEKCLEITLPASYKEFLLQYDGGFICDDVLEGIIKRDKSLETAKWNNCYIFGIQELISEYIDLHDKNWKLFDWEGVYPIVPFARNQTHDLVVFIMPLDDSHESPVFDAFHEDPAKSWGIITGNFSDFLGKYLDTHGQMNCISSSSEKSSGDFFMSHKNHSG